MARRRGSLDDYAKKRDLARSGEPPSRAESATSSRRAGSPRFVVQRHEARRLHYDLRLEVDGALASWAVPRGFSYQRGEKRLAMRTEDHPLEYARFEGKIPAGHYGAGTIEIWDEGTYELLRAEDPRAAIEAGKLEVVLRGKRLRGEWHLVQTRAASNEWLLLKSADVHSRQEGEPAFPFRLELLAARRAGWPRRIEVMCAGEERHPFSDPDWLFEPELLGERVLVKKRLDRTELAPVDGERALDAIGLESILADLGLLRAETAILDAQLVALDAGGRPSRIALASALRGEVEPGHSLTLCVVDLLRWEEWDLRSCPLWERRELLRAIVPGTSRSVAAVEPTPVDGEGLARAVALAGLPGVVAKRRTSAYVAGESADWVRLRIDAETSGSTSSGRLRGAASTPQESAALDGSTGDLASVSESALARLAPLRASRESFGRVRFSRREKVLWPATQHTKGDLIAFYESVAEHLLPYLAERPIHLRRFPDGVDEKSFYHHAVPSHAPGWIETEEVRKAGDGKLVRSVICRDRETLLWLANLASIDLHPWLSRRGSLECPDWLVLDLDPGGAPFSSVIAVARGVGRLLREIDLVGYLKTSGASGLHIFCPLEPRYPYDVTRAFAESVARVVARELPDIATVEHTLRRRRGRVYIDYLRNTRGQTIVPPYVVRPVERPTVSMPLDWDELNGDLSPALFDVDTAPNRLRERGDLWRPALDRPGRLEGPLEALRRRFRGA